jgi:hypothetical protein
MHFITHNYAPHSLSNTWELHSLRDIDHNLQNNDHYIVPMPRIEPLKAHPSALYPHFGMN